MQHKSLGPVGSRRPSILHVLPSFAQSKLLLSTVDPGEADYAVVALDGDGPLLDALRVLNIPAYGIPASGSWASYARELRKIIRSLKPDAVEFHMFRPSLAGSILSLDMRKRPRFVSVRHHNLEHHLMGSTRAVAADRWIARMADRTVAVSETVRRTLIAEGTAPDKIVVVANAINSDAFLSQGEDALVSHSRDSRTLLAIGRLHWIKDYPLMLKVVSRLQERGVSAELNIVGDGPIEYKELLKRQAASLGVQDRVEWLGHVTDVTPYLSTADLLLHTSHDEAFGLAILEAMLIGLPIVAVTSGGADEVLSGFYEPVWQRQADVVAGRVHDALQDRIALSRTAQLNRPRVMKRFDHRAQIQGHISACIH